jgi:hypothetical protein
MRKLVVLAVLAAAVAAPAALAKERNLSMIGAPAAPKAGHAWTMTIRVLIDGSPAEGMSPMVRIVNRAGKTTSITSTPTSKTGIFRARIIFPTAGTWRVIAVDRYSGRAYEFARMKVRAA